MSYKIVVARCRENIQWLQSEYENCVIYNKGYPLHMDNEHFLPNMGRESDTYLHYIITNYHQLPDAVVFTQARIADHKGKDDVNYLLNLKNEALLYSKSQTVHVHHDYGRCTSFDGTWNLREDGYFLRDNYKNNNPVVFIDWFKEHIQPEYPDPILIYGSAIFAVRKELILQHPLEYYEKLRLEVNHHINPAEGHFVERAWYYIFDAPKKIDSITIL
jgi:hypothetical protein